MRTMFYKKLFVLAALSLTITGCQLDSMAFNRDALSTIGGFFSPVSQQQEVVAGAQLDQKIRQKYPPSKNVALQNYVSSIGRRVAAQSGVQYPYSYVVLEDSRTANAFAAPGGFIYITTGLLNMLENESQLAAVLAHETAHVSSRHVIKRLQERSTADVALNLLSRVTDINFNNRLTQIGEAVLFQKFSREDENEADLVGTQMMVKAGYNPLGMVQMLEKLNALNARGVVIPFLQSHPSSESRARLVEEYIQRNQLVRTGQLTDTTYFHQFVR